MKNHLTLFAAAALLLSCNKHDAITAGAQSGIITPFAGYYGYPTTFLGDGGPATTAVIDYATGVVADKRGNVFITDKTRVRKVDKNGIITTFAGGGTVINYDGFPATAGCFTTRHLAIDAQDNLYVAASESRIIKIDPQGIARIIAGPVNLPDTTQEPPSGFGGDGGPATNAIMSAILAIAVDGNGNVYFNDGENFRIRKINAQGIISTVTGGGANGAVNGGMAVNVGSLYGYALATDKYNNLYIYTYGPSIIKVTPDGKLFTIAGGKDFGITPDGKKAVGAKLGYSYGIAVNDQGRVFFSEFTNHKVRMIDGLGVLHTVAGTGSDSLLFDGLGGPAIQASTPNPEGLCFDPYGNLYIGSPRTWSVLKVSR